MLKKVLLLFCVGIITLYVVSIYQTPLFYKYSDSFTVYVGSNSSNADILNTNKSSFMFIKDKRGESCKINGSFDLQSFLSEFDAQLVFTEQTEQGVSYYAYSNKVKYKQQIKSKPINLHVFIGKSGVTVGSPIIYGSF